MSDALEYSGEKGGRESLASLAQGCLIGLAVGDALGGPTENKTPEEIVRVFGRVEGFLNEDQEGSDDTEHALFIARVLLKYESGFSARNVATEWKREILAGSSAHKGAGFSEMLALRNLKKGLWPPESGKHAHSWSDGLAMRVAPFGIVAAGDPGLASRLAQMDGSVTHAGEGIFAGQAVAAAIACAMGGGSLREVLQCARTAVPADSWTARAIERGTEIARKGRGVDDVLRPLYESIACTYYYWSDLGPEAVGLALGVVAASRGNFHDAVLGGVNVGRDTDTIAAIAGAITGAMSGVSAIPAGWATKVNISRGRCLQVVAGMKIDETADRLAALAEKKIFRGTTEGAAAKEKTL